jgi:hypothetical protein
MQSPSENSDLASDLLVQADREVSEAFLENQQPQSPDFQKLVSSSTGFPFLNRIKDKLSSKKEKHQNEKENELPTWAIITRLFLEALDKLIWLVVLSIIAAIIGASVVSQHPKVAVDMPNYIPIVNSVQWDRVDEAIRADLKIAHEDVEKFASQKLDVWVDDLMIAVDNSFLPWYFGYWNQQLLGIQSLFQTAYHWFNGNAATAEETQNKVVETEFNNRVLSPQTAQIYIQALTDESVNRYASILQNKLNITQQRLKISSVRWQRHLQDLALITRAAEGNRGTSLAFKSVGGTTLVGGIAVERGLTKVGAKTLSKTVGKSVGKFTGKTAAKVIAKAGGTAGEAVGEAVAFATAPIVGPILGIGIVAWDLIDHFQTRKVNEPILRAEIEEYLTKMKAVILEDNSTGIMSAIHNLEVQVSESISTSAP